MENVQQMLSVIETGGVGNDAHVELASVTIETTVPENQLLRTRLTALFIGEFGGRAGGQSELVFAIDNEFLSPAFRMDSRSADIRSRSFLVFRDAVPSGRHRVFVQLSRNREPFASVGPRTLTVWETLVPREQPRPGGELVVPV